MQLFLCLLWLRRLEELEGQHEAFQANETFQKKRKRKWLREQGSNNWPTVNTFSPTCTVLYLSDNPDYNAPVTGRMSHQSILWKTRFPNKDIYSFSSQLQQVIQLRKYPPDFIFTWNMNFISPIQNKNVKSFTTVATLTVLFSETFHTDVDMRMGAPNDF